MPSPIEFLLTIIALGIVVVAWRLIAGESSFNSFWQIFGRRTVVIARHRNTNRTLRFLISLLVFSVVIYHVAEWRKQRAREIYEVTKQANIERRNAEHLARLTSDKRQQFDSCMEQKYIERTHIYDWATSESDFSAANRNAVIASTSTCLQFSESVHITTQTWAQSYFDCVDGAPTHPDLLARFNNPDEKSILSIKECEDELVQLAKEREWPVLPSQFGSLGYSRASFTAPSDWISKSGVVEEHSQ